MMTLRLKQQLTASIAILAVLLLFVAPVVSKYLMHHQMMVHEMMVEKRVDGGLSEAVSHQHSMPDMEGMSHMQMDLTAQSESQSQSAFMPEGIACGYCDLLIHVPMMLWEFIPLIWLLLMLCDQPVALPVILRLPRRFMRSHHPRAPPYFGFFY
ncbi:DUF2946 domain-containing protein [Dickeya sp. DW 0440]|uniref:DUF2946 domain-containing protein n=1 Tax=Dickeya sp. DW 0440 TaxID=1225785 RepID=UPI0003A35AF8|nr:DUF2946 domain-containing protein [Dickeya sp. DW 0440]